jgi:hypothetical protein
MASHQQPDRTQKTLLDGESSSPKLEAAVIRPPRGDEAPLLAGPAPAETETGAHTEESHTPNDTEHQERELSVPEAEGSDSPKRRRQPRKKTASDDSHTTAGPPTALPVSPPKRRIPDKKLYQDEIYTARRNYRR